MIDTVIIRVPHELCIINNPDLFSPPAHRLGKFEHCVLQKPEGIYFPNVRIVHWYNHRLASTCTDLVIGFSVSKLLFNNNLQEVTEQDFPKVLDKLHDVLKIVEIFIDQSDLARAVVKGIHFSKNILLENTTSHMVLSTLAKGNMKRLAKCRRDYANNGEKLSFQSKSYEVCFYDKSKEIMSEYQNMDAGDRKQIAKSIIKAIKEKQILRMEVRLNAAFKVKDLLFKYRLVQATTNPNDFIEESYEEEFESSDESCEEGDQSSAKASKRRLKEIKAHKKQKTNYINKLKAELQARDITFEEIFKKSTSQKICNGYYKMIANTVDIEKETDFKDMARCILNDQRYKTGRCFSVIGALFVKTLLGREFVLARSAKKLREIEKVLIDVKQTRNINSVILEEFGDKLGQFELIGDLTKQISSKHSKKAKDINILFDDDISEFGSTKITSKEDEAFKEDELKEEDIFYI